MMTMYFRPIQVQAMTPALRSKIFQVAVMTLAATCVQAADLNVSDIIRQLSASASTVTAKSQVTDDEDQSKSMFRVRRPAANGACLPDGAAKSDENSGDMKALVVVPLAAAGAPQINLPLQFSSASYVLSNADQRQLDALASAMNSSELRGARFTVSGHTDANGDAIANEKLSCARALSARKYLIERGVSAGRLGVYGFGSSRPIGSDADNRRVEIRRADS